MQNAIAIALMILIAHVARAADEPVIDSYEPHVTAEDNAACMARAQAVSACPDLKAEPCDDMWIAFEACMSEVEARQ